ncbi:transglutaminaseTgpA domain-containing protein [Herbiconiux sp. A18JL235]|uniref:TransglutaminaseTgpA domain-containing protein n=1 Tax=Herbiconiux sp. A18JL235 TaxID=3152363 RepID=A0AB39BMC9_9MICO
MAAGIGAALFSLSPLLQGIGWWFAVMAMVTVLLGGMAVIRGRGAPELVVVLSAAVGWAVLVVLLYAPGSLWFVFPTVGTLTDLGADLDAARVSIAVQEAPAVADGAITQLLVMSVGLIAVVSDELASGLRTPVLSGVGPVAILSIAPLVRRDDPNLVVYVCTAVAWLGVLWFGSRIGRGQEYGASSPPGGVSARANPTLTRAGRNGLAATGLGAAAIATMIVVPTVTPGLTADSFTEPGGNLLPSVYSTGIDPSIQLGRDLRRSEPVLSLTYSTDSEEGLYLRMLTLGDFSTGAWEPEQPYSANGYTDGESFGSPPGLAADVPVAETTTSVTIAALRSDWLPLPYPTQQVDGLDDGWLLTPSTFTMTDLRGDTRGLAYQVTSLSPQPTAEQLAVAGSVIPDPLLDYLALPGGLPPVIADTAAAVTAGASTGYERAVALQEYFRSDQFSYSLQTPVEGGFDGDTADAIAVFLDVKSGYCVHYSAAMAVMARTLGIPSRIAVGYAPGQSPDSTAAGGAVYEVYTDQLHAWPELYFEGVGWLPFEPTPGLDFTPPDYSLPDYAQQSSTSDTSAPAPSSTSTSAAERPDDALDVGAVQSPEQLALGQLRGWASFVGIVAAVALVVLTPWAIRRLRRRNRFARLLHHPLPGTLAWAEWEDTLDDHRVQRSQGDTVHDLERRLLDELPLDSEAEEALGRLRRAVEREQYGVPDGVDADARGAIESDLRRLLTAIDAGEERGARYRARFVPVSLLRRRRSTPAAGAFAP